jgi:hypothetical protein
VNWTDWLRWAGRGGYVNYEPDAGEAGVRSAYGDRYGRLSSLKARYDPHNVFRLNQNIAPGNRLGDSMIED